MLVLFAFVACNNNSNETADNHDTLKGNEANKQNDLQVHQMKKFKVLVMTGVDFFRVIEESGIKKIYFHLTTENDLFSITGWPTKNDNSFRNDSISLYPTFDTLEVSSFKFSNIQTRNKGRLLQLIKADPNYRPDKCFLLAFVPKVNSRKYLNYDLHVTPYCPGGLNTNQQQYKFDGAAIAEIRRALLNTVPIENALDPSPPATFH